MTSFERINKQRLEKLERIRAAGIKPYPNSFQRSHTTEQVVTWVNENLPVSKEVTQATISIRNLIDDTPEVTVAGRITARRKMGKLSFLDLRDGSGKIQLMVGNKFNPKGNELLNKLFNEIDIGDILGIIGRPFRTRTNEPTISVYEITLLAKSLEPLPEKWHGLSDVETRYRQRYLDLISNPEVHQTFKLRSLVIAAIRQFLNERGFIEVETPTLQPSAGGALARPFITHHHALDQNFYLRIATELHLKRLIVGGFDKVYELGKTFRNEGINTQHNPEFTEMESYEAYADYNDVMKMVEEMVAKVCQQVLGTLEVKYGENIINFKPPWKRLSLREAILEYSGIDFVKFPTALGLREKMSMMKIEADPQKNWAKLVDELLSTIVMPKIIQPTFIMDYPVSMSPLAKSKPGEERVVERFQSFAGGIEFGNAYSELNDPIEQRKRFEEQIKERQSEGEERWAIDEDYLLALEYGMPPTGGLGIGIDRLVMLLTNQQSIREVILFPQLKEKG
ncbi:MAG: lysine--tRNA ligase [Chloroflexi bacterium]|nr:lysine--tRNA ligase [Chloroflexota bacterium]